MRPSTSPDLTKHERHGIAVSEHGGIYVAGAVLRLRADVEPAARKREDVVTTSRGRE